LVNQIDISIKADSVGASDDIEREGHVLVMQCGFIALTSHMTYTLTQVSWLTFFKNTLGCGFPFEPAGMFQGIVRK
jgi:hypothetical protein